MNITDSERLYATLEDDRIQTSWQPIMMGTTDRFRRLTAERNELPVRLVEYKLCKDNLKMKVSEEEGTTEAATGL